MYTNVRISARVGTKISRGKYMNIRPRSVFIRCCHKYLGISKAFSHYISFLYSLKGWLRFIHREYWSNYWVIENTDLNYEEIRILLHQKCLSETFDIFSVILYI